MKHASNKKNKRGKTAQRKPTHLAVTAEEGMKTPPEDRLFDLPIDVGAVEGGDRGFERTAGRSGGRHHFVGSHYL